MAPVAGFGTSNDSDSRFTKEFKFKEGSNVFRVFPSMHSLVASGTWRIYAGRHFGYEGVSKRDASKTQPRPFKCIQEMDWATKIVTADCPECTLIQQKKEALEARIEELKNDKATKAQIEADEILQNLMGWLKAHNCSRRWFMNVMNAAGECGVLGISNKLKKQLDEKIKILKAEGIDPRDLETGCWFNFIRVGTGWDVPDTVDILMEKIDVPNVGVMERKKKAPVSDQQAQTALQACPDLSNYLTVLTYQQIKLLTETGSDPEAVDRVFAIALPNEPVRAPVAPPAAPKPASASAAAPKPAEAPRAAKEDLPAWAGGKGEPTSPPTPEPTEIDKLRAMLAAAEAKMKTQEAPKPEAPKPAPVDDGTPAPIDFLKKFRINKDE